MNEKSNIGTNNNYSGSTGSTYPNPPTPSAPPSYEESVGYPDLTHLIPGSTRSQNVSPAPNENPSGSNDYGNRATSTNVPTYTDRNDHWGVIGYYQPVQTQDAIALSEPYIVLTLPEDVIPRLKPQQKPNLPYLQW